MRKQQIVCQVVGYKNSGKTTLICTLIQSLTERGYKVAVIKHDTHGFEMDHPGTDTYKQHEAGAAAVALISQHRTAIIEEKGTDLDVMIRRFEEYDIVLIEGYKLEMYSKIVMVREWEHLVLIEQLSNVAAVVSWLPLDQIKLKIGEMYPLHDKDDSKGIIERLFLSLS